MAVSTAGTILKYNNGTSDVKLVDILSYPDLGATPNKLDTTTLSALKFKTSILGLQDIPDLTFECLYDKAALTLINGLTGTKSLTLEFGQSGADLIAKWTGQISAYPNGAGVDEVRKMTVTCSAETEILFS